MDIYSRLIDIVGQDFVSNRQEELYIYSRDSGAQKPRKADYVVMPKTVEEVQKIVILANEEKIPITPMGGGLTLAGLAVPIKGGIVLDTKRMDRIIEVNEKSRYAMIEAGVTRGALSGYLERHYPHLQPCLPEAPPMVTIVGNVLIQGHGHLAARYGVSSQMVNGMEVVLPTGEVCKLGSCSVSPYWFSRDPLPELVGLFLGWLGTTGIVTKLSIQLFPKAKFRDLLIFSSTSDNVDLIPELIFEVAQLDQADNLFLDFGEEPEWSPDIFFYLLFISAQSEKEFELKKELHKNLFLKYENEVEFVEEGPAFEFQRRRWLTVPRFSGRIADVRKGGGFTYTGAILPIEKIPEAWRNGLEIFAKYGLPHMFYIQVIGGHSVMFGFMYPFNRADEEDMERVRKALDESSRLTLDLGGIVWKAELPAQKLILERMDPNTRELMRRVKKIMDPNGIMNPGNWEVI